MRDMPFAIWKEKETVEKSLIFILLGLLPAVLAEEPLPVRALRSVTACVLYPVRDGGFRPATGIIVWHQETTALVLAHWRGTGWPPEKGKDTEKANAPHVFLSDEMGRSRELIGQVRYVHFGQRVTLIKIHSPDLPDPLPYREAPPRQLERLWFGGYPALDVISDMSDSPVATVSTCQVTQVGSKDNPDVFFVDDEVRMGAELGGLVDAQGRVVGVAGWRLGLARISAIVRVPAVLPSLLDSMIDIEFSRARFVDGTWRMECQFLFCDPTDTLSEAIVEALPLTDDDVSLGRVSLGTEERRQWQTPIVLKAGRAVCSFPVAPWRRRCKLYRFQVTYRYADRDLVMPARKLLVIYDVAGSPDEDMDWLGVGGRQ